MKIFFWIKNHKIPIFFGFIAAALLAVPVASYVIIHSHFLPRIHSVDQKVRTYLPEVIHDLQQLEKHPTFAELTFDRNAEGLLSSHIIWRGEGVAFEPSETHVVEKIFENADMWAVKPEQLAELVKTAEYKKLNTDWMEELHNYDHWNISENELLQSQLLRAQRHTNPVAKLGVYAGTVFPDFSVASNFGVLHVLKMQEKGRITQGLRTYRKLAQLIFSTQSIVGNAVAASMLNRERRLAENFKVKSWKPVPTESVDAFRRVNMAFFHYMANATLSGFPQELIPFAKPENGICATAYEYMTTKSLSIYLEGQAPFEVSFAEPLEKFHSLHAQWQKDCELDRKFPTERFPASAQSNTVDKKEPDYLIFLRAPYVRRVFGAYAFQGGEGHIRQYDELKTQ